MKYLFLLSLLLFSVSSFSQRDTCTVYASNTLLPWCCTTADCDKFKIYSDCQIDEFHLKVFNRWGELVFESDDQDEFWIPERINYELVDLYEGDYVWILKGKMTADFDLDGDKECQEFEKRGVVTLFD